MERTKEAEDFLLISAAARKVGVSKDTIREYVKRGRVSVVRASGGVLLFSPREIERFIRARGK